MPFISKAQYPKVSHRRGLGASSLSITSRLSMRTFASPSAWACMEMREAVIVEEHRDRYPEEAAPSTPNAGRKALVGSNPTPSAILYI
jgi:hypothetical protein